MTCIARTAQPTNRPPCETCGKGRETIFASTKKNGTVPIHVFISGNERAPQKAPREYVANKSDVSEVHMEAILNRQHIVAPQLQIAHSHLSDAHLK